MILHDREDWSKASPLKRFCKHVGKLLFQQMEKKPHACWKNLFAKRKWQFKHTEMKGLPCTTTPGGNDKSNKALLANVIGGDVHVG